MWLLLGALVACDGGGLVGMGRPCADSDACAGDGVCLKGVCSGYACAVSADCANGLVCGDVGGVSACVQPCEADDDCLGEQTCSGGGDAGVCL